MNEVPGHDLSDFPAGVHGGRVEEEDGDSIAGEDGHERIKDDVGWGKPRPEGEGTGGGSFDEEEGVGEGVAESFEFVGEEEVAAFGEEVLVDLGEVGFPLDAAPGGGVGEDVVAGGEPFGEGVEADGVTGGGPRHGAARDGEEGGEDEGGLLPVVDEDEVRPLQKTTAGFEPATFPLGPGGSIRAELRRRVPVFPGCQPCFDVPLRVGGQCVTSNEGSPPWGGGGSRNHYSKRGRSTHRRGNGRAVRDQGRLERAFFLRERR